MINTEQIDGEKQEKRRASRGKGPRFSTPLAAANGKKRGSISNESGRFEPYKTQTFDDGWGGIEEELPPLKTQTDYERATTIITRNSSPDLPFDRSINPYRGCEHGCIYCYARPSHAYLGFSPGLDFETRLVAKLNAADLLERELARPNYRVRPIALGTNTDPYQPIEKKHGLTRKILEVLSRAHHPVTILTKNALVLRDLDLLASMAQKNLVHVALSVTTLDSRLARIMEPRASTPHKRLEALKKLSEAGIPTGMMIAPLIPGLNDVEIESILAQGVNAQIHDVHYNLLNLPHELADLFREWLLTHYPEKYRHILNLLKMTRNGQTSSSRFGERFTGNGAYAEMIAQRFRLALERHNLKSRPWVKLNTSLFVPPRADQQQLMLF